MRLIVFFIVCMFALPLYSAGRTVNKPRLLLLIKKNQKDQRDTTDKTTTKADSVKKIKALPTTDNRNNAQNVSLDPERLSKFPAASLQQLLKGKASGLYVQEQTGEPGTIQNLFIRGTHVPLLAAKDVYQTQPTVVIDGIPVISQDHPFAFDIQQYDFTRIGPYTNLLAGVDPYNIESINVLKDFSETAVYGPRGANGVIAITTKGPGSQTRISFNTYIGLATHNHVTTTNGATENNFRKPFYDKYATADQKASISPFLRDSLYQIYYGPSNWTDLYYKNAMVYGLNIGVNGGFKNANFRTSFGSSRNNGVADATGLTRYDFNFALDMRPTQWLDITSSVNGSQLLRDRNKNLRDRFAEVRYIPDVSNPLSPNKLYYGAYLAEYNKAFDKNRNNIVDAYFNVRVTFGKFNFNSRFAVDYREGYRDQFYPSTLLETNSYVSNYFGYNQRLVLENTANYSINWDKDHYLDFQAGQSLQFDGYRYNYGYAYHGTSDYIKLNIFDSPTTPTIAQFSYQANLGFLNTLSYRFIDQTKNNLAAFFGNATYHYKDKYSFSLMLRADGSSNQQPTSRWLYSPIASVTWNLRSDLAPDSKTISQLNLKGSYGRLGRVQQDDRFAAGPQYTVDIGYTGEPRLSTYNGVSTLNRPYTAGYVGYDIPWTYVEQMNAAVNIGLWNNRLRAALDVYSSTDHNELINVPGFAEYGYTSVYMSGMKINNRGVDVEIGGDILNNEKQFQWSSSLNLNFNRNQLKALPNGMNQLVVGNKLLQVGESVDRFWLYKNQGIYNTASQIPVSPKTGKPLNFQGVALQAGDPIWQDVNGDYTIDNSDKVLQGHSLPVVAGGFNNDFRYKQWSLGVDFYFNLGRNVLNSAIARRFDFVNQQNTSNLDAVKEITYWEKRGDYSKYPIYNPWSPVTPYRTDQDLFLENASFLKLRNVSLSYDLTGYFLRKKSRISRMIIYTAVSNVFTITPYTGPDPELVDYTGADTGYGQPIPRTFTLGVKMDL